MHYQMLEYSSNAFTAKSRYMGDSHICRWHTLRNIFILIEVYCIIIEIMSRLYLGATNKGKI